MYVCTVCTVCMLTYMAEHVWAVLQYVYMHFCIFLCTFTHKSIPYKYIPIEILSLSKNKVNQSDNGLSDCKQKKGKGCGEAIKGEQRRTLL